MFTGLIERVGTLRGMETAAGGRRILVRAEGWRSPLEPGESIAVSGVCLTVVGIEGDVFACDVLQETFERTTLGRKHQGCPLNIERALAAGVRMGGHLVTGHVDGVGAIVRRTPLGRDLLLRIACDRALENGMVMKGSVACEGVSLTITRLSRNSGSAGSRSYFETHLVPFTRSNTSLGELKAGDRVNIETDVIGKYVERHVNRQAGAGMTLDRLRDAGFSE